MKPWAPKALVLSGGAVTGGSFMTGGLKAFNEYFENFTVCDFDIFVGISAGSLIAAPLSAGLTPEEMLRSLDGNSTRFFQFAPWHCYWPNLGELVTRPWEFAKATIGYFPGALHDLFGTWRVQGPRLAQTFWQLIRRPSAEHYTTFWNVFTAALSTRSAPSWLQLLPTGFFDNAPIERYLRRNIERNHLTNNFQVVERVRKKRLYICAMTLDTAERVVFGPDERRDVTISEAVQASTALPVFYRPARIHGVDYVDGGVFETAHIDVAVAKGAQLIVCYNPFRPIENRVLWDYVSGQRTAGAARPLSVHGIMAVLNQIFRAVFHTRLQQTLAHYRRDDAFTGDIVVIEPHASDMAYFELNPLLFGHRIKAAQMGFESVRNSIESHYDEMAAIFRAYGIQLTRTRVAEDFKRLRVQSRDPWDAQRVLEGRDPVLPTDQQSPPPTPRPRRKRPKTRAV